MSFGVSPLDVVELVKYSTRIYVAFKDTKYNSASETEALIKEFTTLHHCLIQLDELMKEYGKPLPFPGLDFYETLHKCEKTLKPYTNNHVDNEKMPVERFTYTIKHIGKETELDELRKKLIGNYQALQMCISFLQLQMYSNYALDPSSEANRNALPAPSEAEKLYKDWVIFNRSLQNVDQRMAYERESLSRPLPLGDTPTNAPGGDAETVMTLFHLRRELEDAIVIEENEAKRVTVENRTNLLPGDAILQEVRETPFVPARTFGLDLGMPLSALSKLEMNDSTTAVPPVPTTSSGVSPSGDPQIEQGQYTAVNWGKLSLDPSRTPVSIGCSDLSTMIPEPGLSDLGRGADGLTPEDDPLRPKFSISRRATPSTGDGALEWRKLCRNVQVERRTSKGVESKECDVHWRYREDYGLSLRSVYRVNMTKKAQVWITQQFPATGPSIPLTTSYPDGEISIGFPRRSFGRLEKRYTDIMYTFSDQESSTCFQTFLYTNNGKDKADLLFDRPILTISSDKNKPECRQKNIRLWKRSEKHQDLDGIKNVDILVLLFYTSALPEDRSHWVEEPHYAFQQLDNSIYKRNSRKLELLFLNEPAKRFRRLFKKRAGSGGVERSGENPGTPTRMNKGASGALSSSISIKSSNSELFELPIRTRNLNRFGFSKFDIEFQSKKDRSEFLAIWKHFTKP
ncbi:uncharacterized protein BDR25DRAFT_264609, partial [Lindgomyces ingoldianus]